MYLRHPHRRGDLALDRPRDWGCQSGPRRCLPAVGALFWNAPEPPGALADAFAEASRQVMPQPGSAAPASKMSAADGYSMMVAKAAGGLRAIGGFSDIEEWRFD